MLNQNTNDMKNLINLFGKFANLNGAKFISLVEYKSEKTGEIATHVINTNISVMNAKQSDFETLKATTTDNLKIKEGLGLDVYNLALSEMTASAEKNLNPDKSKRTKNSVGQTDAYITLTNGLKVHKETGNLHIFGMAVAKNVIKAGEYKQVNSADKTLAKKDITKQLNLKAGKFRTFIVGNIKDVKMNGETIEIYS